MKHYFKIMVAAGLTTVGMMWTYIMGVSCYHLTSIGSYIIFWLALVMSWVCLGYGISWLMSLARHKQ